MKQKWLLGTLPIPGRIDTTHVVTQFYSNLVEDGTQKKEFTETDQILALKTLVYQMKASLVKNTISLTTHIGKPPVYPANPWTGSHNNSNTPYTITTWILDKRVESKTEDGI